MPGQEIVREAIKTSWTIDKIAGVVVVILAILLVSMVVSQNTHIKRLIGNFQKTNEILFSESKPCFFKSYFQKRKLNSLQNRNNFNRNSVQTIDNTKLHPKLKEFHRRLRH